MIKVIMPQVGQDIPTAKIIEWHKRENDPVEKGEVIAVVESDKASFEVEAEQGGVVLKVLYAEGEEVAVFEAIAYIGEAGEDVGEVRGDVNVAADVIRPATPLSNGGIVAGEHKGGKVFASPSARRIARERGVDLSTIVGSGPNGRIIHSDVIAGDDQQAKEAARATVVAMETDEVVVFSRMRKRIADRLTQSKQTIPHFYLFVDVDMTAAMAWRELYNQKNDVKVTVTDLIIIAAARALALHRSINAHVDQEKVVVKREINIGIATSVDDGLLVPVLTNVDTLDLQQISVQSKKLAKDARRGMVDPNNVGTFTVSTLGMFGIKSFLPIINPPEAGILAVGAIEKRVVPIEGGIGVGDMMTLTMAVDHRAVDGVKAAKFLDQLKQNLENIDQVEV